jgi:hypothetical protein
MRTFRFAFFAVACLAAATIADAQVNRATISGTVTDPSGAPIPGVTVTIAGESGLSQTAVTGEAGQYTVPSLPVGTYSAKFEIQGFKTSVRSGLTLQVAQTLRLDAQLEVGNLAETVTVSGAFDVIATRLREVALTAPLYLAGAAADQRVAKRAHGSYLAGDPVTAAETLAAGAT